MKSAIATLLSAASVAALAAPISAGDGTATWLRLVPAGKFAARDGRSFDAGDRSDMETIVARTRQYHASTDIVVDYDHQSMFGAKDGVGGTARAAGWIKELQVRDDGIFGRVEWTAAASASIKAGEYRYLSPAIPHRKADGKVILILNAALTNTPALDLEAAAASALFADHTDKGNDMDKILAALGLAAGADESAVLSAINALLTSSTAMARAAGLTDQAKPAEIQAAVCSALADRTKIATAAGLQDKATADEIVTAVMSAVAGAKPDPAKFVPIEQVSAMQADLKALKETLVGDKADVAVATAIKDGKLIPALKDWGLALFKSSPAEFAKFTDAAPVLTAPQLSQVKRDPNAAPALSDADLAICSAMGIDPKKFAETAKSLETGAH